MHEQNRQCVAHFSRNDWGEVVAGIILSCKYGAYSV